MRAYQIDDLVMAGGQQIAPVVMEGLAVVRMMQNGVGREYVRHLVGYTCDFLLQEYRRRAASREPGPGSIS